MNIYLITLVGALLLSYFAERFSTGEEDENGNLILNKYYIYLLIIFLTVISGFRYMNYFLGDEYNYRVGVNNLMGTKLELSNLSITDEWLFHILSWISANIFKDSQALIFFAAFITNGSIVLFFKKYARPFWLAIFLYICGGAYFTSMNILRQYMAVALIVWCYPLIRKRKFVPYLILVVISAGIHSSALIMLPAYFILRRKKIDLCTIAIVGMAFFIFANFETIMMSILPNIGYDEYLDNILSGGYGVKFIRVAAWLIPYIIILIHYKYFVENLYIGYEIIYSIIIISCILIVSLKYVYVARLDVFFSIVSYTCINKIPDLFKINGRLLVIICMCTLFFIFGCYQMWNFLPYHNVLFENIDGILYLK